MAVGTGRQTEVAFVLRLVAGLGHGPQAQAPHQELPVRALHVPQNALQGRGRGLHGHQSGVDGFQGIEQALQPLGIGLGMHAVEEGLLRGALHAAVGFQAAQMAGHGFVGRDHEFLDEAVRVMAHTAGHAQQAALAVKAVFRFRQVEIQAAPALPGLAQATVQSESRLQHVQHFLPARSRGQRGTGLPVPVQQAGLDLIVGQAGRRAHDHRREARFARLPGGGKGDLGQHGQPVLVRAQAAQAVAQGGRQHGLHRRGEIPGIAARQGFGIQRRARAHIMAHVGDGHTQEPAPAGTGLHLQGVVEVTGIGAVDGHQRQRAHVLAPGHVGMLGRGRQGVGLGLDPGRELPRYLVVELDQILLHGDVVFPAHGLQQARLPEVGGQTLFRRHQQQRAAGRALHVPGQLHADIEGHAAVRRTAQGTASGHMDHMHGHFAAAALQHLHDAALPALAAGMRTRRQGHAHHVPMPGIARLQGMDEDIRAGHLPVVAQGRHETARAAAQGHIAAAHLAQAVGTGPEPALQAHQPAFVSQGVKLVFQHLAGRTRQARDPQQGIQAQGALLFVEYLQQLGIRKAGRKIEVVVFLAHRSLYAAQGGDVCTRCPSVLHTGPGPACQSRQTQEGRKVTLPPLCHRTGWPPSCHAALLLRPCQ